MWMMKQCWEETIMVVFVLNNNFNTTSINNLSATSINKYHAKKIF
jgi:hypothetical protein